MIRKELFLDLCYHFDIHPDLKLDNSLPSDKGGYFHVTENYYTYGQIVLSPRAYLPMKMLITHEFAHALYYFRTNRVGNHDALFYDNLKDAIQVQYSSLRRYPWRYEYKRLYGWAKQEGITN